MNRSRLPPAAFVDPYGRNIEEVQEFATPFIELLRDFATGSASRSPLPRYHCDLDDDLFPEEPVAQESILRQLDSMLESSMNCGSPGWMGHMNSMPNLASILGDCVAALVDNNMLAVETAPVFTALEWKLGQLFGSRFGLGTRSAGNLVAGGTIANMQGLAVARNAKLDTHKKSLAASGEIPVVLASEIAHVSVRKAAGILGLGEDGVVAVPTDSRGRMCLKELRRAVKNSQRATTKPFCIVATAGTTSVGSIDPIEGIAEIAFEYDLWLHVDAAYGGAIAFSRTHQHQLKGIERADSIVFNPHKWFNIARNCSFILFRDKRILDVYFHSALPYMRAGRIPNLSEYSMHGTQHADVVKLWLALQHIGRGGFEQLIDEAYRLTELAVNEVKVRPHLDLILTPDLNMTLFRFGDPTLPGALGNTLCDQCQRFLLDQGVFLSVQIFRGRKALRLVPLNPFTEDSDIQRVFALVDQFWSETQGK